ncbi:MAG: DUF4446 family protein [Lachnospiraceae bacterium]|nr:DUF4446 family protein [Lachnospiraceae bacterium]
MGLFDKIGIDSGILIIVLFILLIVLFLYCLSMRNLILKYKKRQDLFLQGSDGKSLEKSILQKFREIDKAKEKVEDSSAIVKELKEYGKFAFQKFAVHKYDAFEGMGGKLSFSLCVLTDNNDGFILSAVHNEIGGCYTYVKEIIRGEAYVVLSSEEKKALERAKERKSCLDD